jgi:hypothetical protein
MYLFDVLLQEHFNWYGVSEQHGPIIISYKYSIDQNKQRSIVSIVRQVDNARSLSFAIVRLSIDDCRTRQRTSIESLVDVHSSIAPADILRRLCEQCSIIDIDYFDPVLCDGVCQSTSVCHRHRTETHVLIELLDTRSTVEI